MAIMPGMYFSASFSALVLPTLWGGHDLVLGADDLRKVFRLFDDLGDGWKAVQPLPIMTTLLFVRSTSFHQRAEWKMGPWKVYVPGASSLRGSMSWPTPEKKNCASWRKVVPSPRRIRICHLFFSSIHSACSTETPKVIIREFILIRHPLKVLPEFLIIRQDARLVRVRREGEAVQRDRDVACAPRVVVRVPCASEVVVPLEELDVGDAVPPL